MRLHIFSISLPSRTGRLKYTVVFDPVQQKVACAQTDDCDLSWRRLLQADVVVEELHSAKVTSREDVLAVFSRHGATIHKEQVKSFSPLVWQMYLLDEEEIWDDDFHPDNGKAMRALRHLTGETERDRSLDDALLAPTLVVRIGADGVASVAHDGPRALRVHIVRDGEHETEVSPPMLVPPDGAEVARCLDGTVTDPSDIVLDLSVDTADPPSFHATDTAASPSYPSQHPMEDPSRPPIGETPHDLE